MSLRRFCNTCRSFRGLVSAGGNIGECGIDPHCNICAFARDIVYSLSDKTERS
jgi:hypothetical protein